MVAEKENIRSIYARCNDVREEERERRINEAIAQGVYASREDALAGIATPSVMSMAKNIVTGGGASKKSPFLMRVESIKLVINKYMDITGEEFYSLWDVDLLKDYNLYTHINNVIDSAPTKIKEECYFNPKLIFFSVAYPEEMEKMKEDALSPRALFFGRSDKEKDVLSSLKKAGNIDCLDRGKVCKNGNSVDKIVMSILKDTISEDGDISDVDSALEFLSSFDCRKKKNGAESAAIKTVVKSRGYSSLIDFYFLNLDSESQKKNFFSYLYFREKAEIEHEPCIENYAKAYYFCEIFGKSDQNRLKEIALELKDSFPEKSVSQIASEAREMELQERRQKATDYYNKIMDGIRSELGIKASKKKEPSKAEDISL